MILTCNAQDSHCNPYWDVGAPSIFLSGAESDDSDSLAGEGMLVYPGIFVSLEFKEDRIWRTIFADVFFSR